MKHALLFSLVLVLTACASMKADAPKAPVKKLYWLIPDGMRADQGDFNIYKWAREGKLPNIKRMIEEGSYGYSIPDFPSHTPINFATLLTGTHPAAHGVADGPMHTEGHPLDKPSVAGFGSAAKKVPPVWKTMEAAGKKVMLLSIPGSTPPEIRETTVRGRWGGWGADTFNMVFESEGKLAQRKAAGRGFRLFFMGAPLTKFVPVAKDGAHLRATLTAHGLDVGAALVKTAGKFDRMRFFLNDKQIAELKEGQWSEWTAATLKFKDVEFPSDFRVKVVKIWPDGNFRLRVLYNNLNRLIAEPGTAAEALSQGVGPMVDHADNWPPQLVFEKEDKDVFLDEMRMSLDWHKRAVPFVYQRFKPDVFIQDTYTPNQMLESRWWHREIDQSRRGYSKAKAEAAWKDILEMYQGLDAILGEAMKSVDKDSLVVLSSDHGVCPLHKLVHLNNLFAKKGWLKFKMDEKTGEPVIDWKNTKVIYLKMLHVYVHPDGLEGDWTRAKGPEYEKLRNEVVKALQELKDSNGVKPLVRAVKWEDSQNVWDLPMDRVGDLVIETRVNYFWYEEVDKSLKLFSDPLTSGYKQSLDPKANHCMWTPFVMWGPGVKRGHQLSKPVSHADQLPTFYRLMGVPVPAHVQGKVIEEALTP